MKIQCSLKDKYLISSFENFGVIPEEVTV